ncbi:hypothetical protein [Paraburkholderia sp. J63]|uniref:hypothetical protein n=1 Tax=Paraburkholderia sp. J63 TaxID=2805434 RepID=UPI002ABE606C|nr:hypothetical protein [Paraburkholderia sp. J63]
MMAKLAKRDGQTAAGRTRKDAAKKRGGPKPPMKRLAPGARPCEYQSDIDRDINRNISRNESARK